MAAVARAVGVAALAAVLLLALQLSLLVPVSEGKCPNGKCELVPADSSEVNETCLSCLTDCPVCPSSFLTDSYWVDAANTSFVSSDAEAILPLRPVVNGTSDLTVAVTRFLLPIPGFGSTVLEQLESVPLREIFFEVDCTAVGTGLQAALLNISVSINGTKQVPGTSATTYVLASASLFDDPPTEFPSLATVAPALDAAQLNATMRFPIKAYLATLQQAIRAFGFAMWIQTPNPGNGFERFECAGLGATSEETRPRLFLEAFPGGGGGGSSTNLLPIVLPSVLVPLVLMACCVICFTLLLAGFLYWWMGRVKRPSGLPSYPTANNDVELGEIEQMLSETVKIIDLKEIKLIKHIGKGASGEVFQGQWLGTNVAVKKLAVSWNNKDMGEEFRKECTLLRNLHHPNILQFLGVSVKPEVCIITEFMSKGSLHDFLHDKRNELPYSLILKFAIGAARGINYLHHCNPKIIHRDIKSHNLLIDESDVVKVCDFGISTAMNTTATMTSCGTPQWMAPEVMRNEKYSEKADVYSFGLVMWEMLTREVPFEEMSPTQAVFEVLQNNIRPAVPPHAPPEYAQLMQQCWDENPDVRPPFEDIVSRLDGLAANA